MQRYHNAANCTSAVNNSGIAGISARDSGRSDSSSLSSNFSINSRRAPPLVPYKLKCEKEPLNSRLGPPDFHPQTPNCPEETLTKEYVQSGYRETVEGLEEAKEISVSQVNTFSKPVVIKCKEAIGKRLRAINESRAQKRKAGQVYGEPLSGLLLSKPGVFPEQKSFGEDFKRRWIEGLSQFQGLSQYHKSLQSLADHVPGGYRKKTIFEVLIRNNIPLLRATWFIKITYLNQIRPGSSGTSDRSYLSRSEHWTKDVTDYLQYLLDEISKNNSQTISQNRDRSSQIVYPGAALQKGEPASSLFDAEEPSLHFKWWYVVRILNWHNAEGLVIPSQVIDWVFLQFQEKDLLIIMQYLLPIIYNVLDTITLCQTYVRKLVDISLRYLKEPSISSSDPADNSQRAYTSAALVEMLQYLVMSVPDTFVALDYFPLPRRSVTPAHHDGYFTKSSIDAEYPKNGPPGVLHIPIAKGVDTKCPSSWFNRVVSSIQKRAICLAKAASTGYSGQNVAKAVQALDKALVQGDVQEAYKCLFEDLSDSSVDESWIREVSPCLRSSLKWLGSVSTSLVNSVFLLCEWCTCDFRDSRTAPLHDVKFTGRKDFSQLYVAARLMKLKIREIERSGKGKKSSERAVRHFYDRKISYGSVETSYLFESPGPLHDITVCWIDQHEVQKGEGFKRVQLLLLELIRSGIFSPQAYVRQLLVSGIMDKDGPAVDLDRRKRHHRILKQFPGSCMRDVFDEARIADMPFFLEALHVYSSERRLLLRGLLGDEHKELTDANSSSQKQKVHLVSQKDFSIPSLYQLKMLQLSSSMSHSKSRDDIELGDLKISILELLHLPKSSAEASVDESLVTLKPSAGTPAEVTPGCEECRRAKRQKLGEEKYSFLQGASSNPSDDEDTWWVRKEPKSMDSFKVDQPLKPSKQAPRGRQKTVRKTQSLAQLAAARIEGSQGASTSHVCDNRVVCPHHRPVVEGDAPRCNDGRRTTNSVDIFSIGKMLKRLKFVEKKSISVWLMSSIKQVVEETEKTCVKVNQLNRSSVDEKNSVRWNLGEDELSVILYLMDICTDLPAAIRFLIWLLPKAVGSVNTPIHGGRNMMILPRNLDSHACEVREAFLLSSIRRYENVLVAVDLIPEMLSAAMHRASAVVASNGKLSGSPTFLYARYLLKKYGTVSSVLEWEKSFKATCDKRLLSELESVRLQNGEFGFSYAVPAGSEDLDDFIRQKISGNRLSRTGMSMREIVQRYVDDAVHHLFGKERKLFVANAQKNAGIEKWDGGYQIAQQIVGGLMDCIRQTGGAAQEGDPSLVSSAVSAIVGNVGPAIAKMPDFTAVTNHSNFPAPTGSLGFARRVLRIHINCLCLLKEALGERHSRAFEIALATEASSALAGVLLPSKGTRGQLSPESHESNVNSSNDVPNNSTKVAAGRATKIAAAVSALIIGAVIHGVASLERLVTVFRLREGLDLMQFVRSTRSHSNGSARSVGALKVENALEVYIHWFRLLVGNCRTVSDGVIVELLGEPSVVALSRMQRTLPLDLVLPPAYSLFAFLIWRPFIINVTMGNREEIPQLFQSLTLAISDAIRHSPFRDVCLRDTHGFFDLVTSDSTDYDFASTLELNGMDRKLKAKAFVPLRARLFLNALIDCKLPHAVSSQDDGSRLSGINDLKLQYAESETKISDRFVRTLDSLQPAKFHWQWVELRLFLSEQTLIEKLDSTDSSSSVTELMRSLSPNAEKGGSLDYENNFIPIILTRLLVRPRAAPLISELVHLLGRSLEDSMWLHVKWFLEGADVLLGRKSIRQRLVQVAESKGFSTRAQFWKPWGWCLSSDTVGNRSDKRRFETQSLEEGEVLEEDPKKRVRGAPKVSDHDSLSASQQFVTERALVELVLPCIDRSSDDSRSRFASELIKQMNNIEQQISGSTCGSGKQTASPSGTEGSSKTSNRKNARGGSPVLARRAGVPASDSTPASAAALRACVSLRLQLLVRMLPTICSDGDQSGRSSRFTLALVILRLLGSRVVYEDMDSTLRPGRGSSLKEAELQMETSAAVSLDLSGKNVFDWLLLVLHALLSTSLPSWLRSKSSSTTANAPTKEFSGFDRELLESLQSELDRMNLPDAVRWRIQAAMPVPPANPRTYISCQPPFVSSAALASLQPSTMFTAPSQVIPVPKNNSSPSVRTATAGAMLGKKSVAMPPDHDMEVDPWLVLEDGAGSGPSSSNTAVMGGGDSANLKASPWLKGAVRMRRMDLTYIGAVDDDS